ncbi:MAG: alkaline phosphatase family protein [Anaerolineae bacterium]
MRRRGGVILSIVLLPLLVLLGYFLMMRFQGSFEGFRTPLKDGLPLPDAAPSSPVVQQVVYVIVDGLRYDASLEMPFLNGLRKQGAYAVMHSKPPSYSQPSWTTLVTGAWPDINDCPPLNADYEDIKPFGVDHLFAAVRRAGLTSAAAGFVWWEKMIPQDLLQAGFYVEGEDDAADRAVLAKSLEFLTTVRPNLLLYMSS